MSLKIKKMRQSMLQRAMSQLRRYKLHIHICEKTPLKTHNQRKEGEVPQTLRTDIAHIRGVDVP